MVAAIRVVPVPSAARSALEIYRFLAPLEKKDTAQRDSGFFLAGFV
jgi:hypothetical protein